MGTFTLTQVHFLWKKITFTSLLWVKLLSLLYLNAIQVLKNASIYSKRAVYFSQGNERCPIREWFILWVNSVQRLDQTIWQTSESVRESVWMIRSVPAACAESSEAVHSDNIKSDEDVALDLQSIESKSAKAIVC